eukprot:234335-Alexandrium_andersonii.AAC.1
MGLTIRMGNVTGCQSPWTSNLPGQLCGPDPKGGRHIDLPGSTLGARRPIFRPLRWTFRPR